MIRIGIVDDHQLFIDGLKSIFDQVVGIEVTIEANDGFAYLRKMKSEPVDLTITDIRMPEMSGYVLTRDLIKAHDGHKVLVLSMCDQPADIRDIIKARAKGYLPKNVDKDQLISAIHEIIDGGTVYPAEYSAYYAERTKYNGQHMPALTKREVDILKLVAHGRTSQNIADALQVSKHTVDTHRKNIHRKLDLEGSAALIKYAIEHYR